MDEGFEPKLLKGPDTSRRRRRRDCARRSPISRVLLTGPARGYVRGELERLGVPYRHVLARLARGARPRVSRARRLPRDLASGGRAEGGARVDGGRRAARHDARRPGARSSSWTARTAARRRGRRRRARAAVRARPRRPRAPRAAAACGRVDGGGATRTSGSIRGGRELLKGFVDRCTLTARGSGATRAPRRAGPACSCRRRAPTGHPRVLRPRPRARGRETGRRRDGEVPAARGAVPEQPDGLHAPLPRVDRGCRATSPAAPTSRGAAASRSSSTRTASRIRGGRATETDAINDRFGARCSPPTTCSTRASSASGPPTSSSASRRDVREVLYNAVDVERFTPAGEPPPDGPVLLLGGDQTQAYRLEVALRTLARVLEPSPARLIVSGPARVRSAAAPRELGRRGPRRARRAATRSATRRRCSAARTSCCTRR